MCCRDTYGISDKNSNVDFDASMDIYTDAISSHGYTIINVPERAYINATYSDDAWLSKHCIAWAECGGRVAIMGEDGKKCALDITAHKAFSRSVKLRIYGDAVVVTSGSVKVLLIRKTATGDIDAFMPKHVMDSVEFERDRLQLAAAHRTATVRCIDRQYEHNISRFDGAEIVSVEETGLGTDEHTITREITVKRRPTKE